MKSNMLVSVGFLGGTGLEQAVEEAKQKAALWDVVYVCFSFNGRTFRIGRNADVRSVIDEWESDRHSKNSIIAA